MRFLETVAFFAGWSTVAFISGKRWLTLVGVPASFLYTYIRAFHFPWMKEIERQLDR